MKKTIIFYLCIIIPLVSIFSQSNYKEGYIITNSNDTIVGQIDFRTDHTNSSVCKFKKTETAVENKYYPGDIAGYRFLNEGKYYVSRTLDINGLQKNVFLEFLVQGLLNLYYLQLDNDYYFFENKNGELISFTKKPDEIIENNRIKTDNRYKGIISSVLKDDLPLALKTSNIGFDRKSMIECTKEYHNDMCESGEKCIIFENDYTKKFTKFELSAFTGVELNNIKINDSTLSQMLSVSPIIGIGLNISSPRLLKSLSLILDATLSKIDGTCYYSNEFTNFQYSFKGIKSNFSGGLEYIYQKGRIRPTASAELSYQYLFNLESSLKRTYQTITNVKLPLNSSPGIKAGIGADFQIRANNFIVVRLLYSNHNNHYDVNNTLQLKLGYKF